MLSNHNRNFTDYDLILSQLLLLINYLNALLSTCQEIKNAHVFDENKYGRKTKSTKNSLVYIFKGLR